MPELDRIPPQSKDELKVDREASIQVLRTERLDEETVEYHEAFEASQGLVEDLLELTDDLRNLEVLSSGDLAERKYFKPFRYIAGPPISEDDLKMLAGLESVSFRHLKRDAEARNHIVALVRDNHDRSRFPWLYPDAEPDECEKRAAVLATATMMAAAATAEQRKSKQAKKQDAFCKKLIEVGYTQVKLPSPISRREELPGHGEFCRGKSIRSDQDGGHADIIVRRWDGLVVPIECTASSTELNSKKRIIEKSITRARGWRRVLGAGTAPAVMLAGAYSMDELDQVQSAGIGLWWFHNPKRAFEFLGQGKRRAARDRLTARLDG
ncbi:XamI family restriction endonuclease [Actinomadura rupiterrae]|uniref:XamI family restriction endonuclease n=1 Tax=Actinomadura rupiterrae TaxID=559627 RepID=UPI0020A3A1E6|nr:XamI family restriction endonuclease [Actinomadura rupiterrae]MCP2342984.1 hypothetical protein [Actinomadura rupiterrae]